MLRGLIAAVGVRVVVIVVIAAVLGIGGLLLRNYVSGNAGDLQVGDCFDVPDASTVGDVQHHPCDEAHSGEVILVVDYVGGGSTLPSDAEFDTFAKAQCIPAFEAYLGKDYETDTIHDYGFFYPLSDGWNKGDREVTCYAFDLSGDPMTKSVKVGT